MNEFKKTKIFFIKGNPTKIGMWITKKFYRNVIELLVSKGIRSILEIGVGRAIMADVCREYNLNYMGIDADESICELGRSKGHYIIKSHVPPMPETDKVDAVICFNTIEHLNTYTEAEQLIKQARERLSYKGYIAITAPDIRYSKWYFWDCHSQHNWVTSKYRLECLLVENNFEIVESYFSIEIFRGILMYLIWFTARLLKILPSKRRSAFYKIQEKCPLAFVMAKKI